MSACKQIEAAVFLLGTLLLQVHLSSATPKKDPFAQSILKQHNIYRVQNGLSKLIYDDEIAKFAQEWAEHLVKDEGGSLKHHDIFGLLKGQVNAENLFSGNAPVSGKSVARSWYSEHAEAIRLGDFSSKIQGHYLNIVYPQTQLIGCGKARGPNNVVVCCDYRYADDYDSYYYDD